MLAMRVDHKDQVELAQPADMAVQSTWASMCWAVNFVFMFVLVRMMQLHAPPPALEILAFAGYGFVGYSAAIPFGWVLGRKLGWYTAWLYTSFCMATFLIRSLGQVTRVDAAQRGAPSTHSHMHMRCK